MGDSEVANGKEWDGVPISSDAIKLSHSMCWRWWIWSLVGSGLATHSPTLWGWFSTMFANGVQRFSSNNYFYGPLAFSFVASSARLDSHEKHEIAHQSSLQAICWIPFENQQWPKVFHHWSFSTTSQRGIKIALYPKIHQMSSLDTLIHTVFLALKINYIIQGYMDDRAILTTKNTIVNYLNIQIAEVVLRWKHIFLSANSVEIGDD